MRKLLLALLLASLPATSALKDVYCVTISGTIPSPNPDGCQTAVTTWALAGSTIKADIGGASPYALTKPVAVLFEAGTWNTGEGLAGVPATRNLTATASNFLNIRPMTGASVTLDCANATNSMGFRTEALYTVVQGFTIKNCAKQGLQVVNYCVARFNDVSATPMGIGGTGVTGVLVEENYIHDSGIYHTNSSAVNFGTSSHDNIMRSNEIVSYRIAYQANTGEHSNLVQDNLGCCLAPGETNAYGYSGAGGQIDGTFSGNIFYQVSHMIQPLGITAGVITTGNIGIYNTFNLHGEAQGTLWAYRNTVYRCMGVSTNTCDGILQNGANNGGLLNAANILWQTNYSTIVPIDINMNAVANFVESDYNVLVTEGNAKVGQIKTPRNVQYSTLAAWQTGTGLDTHSLSVNPRFLGNKDLLATPGRVTIAGCATVACKVAYLRRNYMPTNLALKGLGCAWNGSTCVADHSDIGAVPITVYNAPGITGGGVY